MRDLAVVREAYRKHGASASSATAPTYSSAPRSPRTTTPRHASGRTLRVDPASDRAARAATRDAARLFPFHHRCGPTPPLREAAVTQNEEEPTDKLVGVLTLRQLIVRAHEGILHGIFRGIRRAQHPCRVARIAVAIAFDQLCVALAVAREHRPNDVAIRLCFSAQPVPPLKSGHIEEW